MLKVLFVAVSRVMLGTAGDGMETLAVTHIPVGTACIQTVWPKPWLAVSKRLLSSGSYHICAVGFFEKCCLRGKVRENRVPPELASITPSRNRSGGKCLDGGMTYYLTSLRTEIYCKQVTFRFKIILQKKIYVSSSSTLFSSIAVSTEPLACQVDDGRESKQCHRTTSELELRGSGSRVGGSGDTHPKFQALTGQSSRPLSTRVTQTPTCQEPGSA